MDLIRENIHMTRNRCDAGLQITLDDDFNVPDAKPDVEKIIQVKGNVVLRDHKILNGKVLLNGKLLFHLLYISNNVKNPVHCIRGELPFEELVNMDEAKAEDCLEVQSTIEDLTAEFINSRKLNVRSILSFRLTARELYDENAITGVRDEVQLCMKKETIPLTQLVVCQKDQFRLKEELYVSAGKPDIGEIIYEEAVLGEQDIRVMDGRLGIKGDLSLCILYLSGADGSICSLEKQLSYNEELEIAQMKENMIPCVVVRLGSQETQIRQDEDGENRVISWEAVLMVDIRMYEETSCDMISDAYQPWKETILSRKETTFEHLLFRNCSKLRLTEQFELENGKQNVLQILLPEGSIKLDEMRIVDQGIELEGVLDVKALYLSGEEEAPIGTIQGVLPFSHFVEIPQIRPQDSFHVEPQTVALGVMMLGSDQAEVKAILDFDVIVFEKKQCRILTDIELKNRSSKELAELPGLVGYMVKPGENLWDIAKQFCTTVEDIVKINELPNEQVEAGNMLVLMKKLEEYT